MLETDILSFELTGIDGVRKTYHLRPIMRKEANWVFHTFIQSTLKAASRGIDSVTSIIDSVDRQRELVGGDVMQAVASIGDAIDSVDFDKVYAVADLLFAGGTVISCTTDKIHNDSCTVEFQPIPDGGRRRMGAVGEDYFRDHPDELYTAVVKAINANWPNVFLQAQKKLGVLKAFIKKVSKGPTESSGQ